MKRKRTEPTGLDCMGLLSDVLFDAKASPFAALEQEPEAPAKVLQFPERRKPLEFAPQLNPE